MKQINQYDFYELGREMRSLEMVSNGSTKNEAYGPLIRSKWWLERLLADELVELTHCRHEAKELLDAINDLYSTEFVNENGELNFENWEQELGAYLYWKISSALPKFEHNFAAELRGAATYYVPRIGIYATQRLVDESETQIPKDLIGHMSDIAKRDYHDAGRCLAFSLATASGYHAARSVEGMLARYCEEFTGTELNPHKATMYDSLEALKKLDGEGEIKP